MGTIPKGRSSSRMTIRQCDRVVNRISIAQESRNKLVFPVQDVADTYAFPRSNAIGWRPRFDRKIITFQKDGVKQGDTSDDRHGLRGL